MTVNEWFFEDGSWKLIIGRIGCLVVSVEKQYPDNIKGWRVAWHEQSDYVYSEGIRLEPAEYLYPYTDDGLQRAKQAGIKFAMELLNQAIHSLSIHDNPDPAA